MLNLLKKGCACMKMIDIGYHHKHDASFVNARPDGTDYALLLIVNSNKQVNRYRGYIIRFNAPSFYKL